MQKCFFFLIHIAFINHAIHIGRKPAGSGPASGAYSLSENAFNQ